MGAERRLNDVNQLYDVVALGELLVDFAPGRAQGFGAWPNLQPMPGGAPGNFIAACATYGLRTSFIGAVGDDRFGTLLIETLADTGVATDGILRTGDAFTTLAFVILDSTGDRDFSFSRKPGADTLLTLTPDHKDMIRNSRCFHFGTISMTDDPAKTATQEAVELALDADVWVNFDPNYRAPLWKSMVQAREAMRWGASRCNSIKIGKDELALLYETDDFEAALEKLMAEPNLKLALITDGAQGSEYVTQTVRGHVDAFRMTDTCDTTGAGDIFGGALMACLLGRYDDLHAIVSLLSVKELEPMVTFATAAAALSTTAPGGISSIPSLERVERFLLER